MDRILVPLQTFLMAKPLGEGCRRDGDGEGAVLTGVWGCNPAAWEPPAGGGGDRRTDTKCRSGVVSSPLAGSVEVRPVPLIIYGRLCKPFSLPSLFWL